VRETHEDLQKDMEIVIGIQDSKTHCVGQHKAVCVLSCHASTYLLQRILEKTLHNLEPRLHMKCDNLIEFITNVPSDTDLSTVVSHNVIQADKL
jgi:hypothetical protein